MEGELIQERENEVRWEGGRGEEIKMRNRNES